MITDRHYLKCISISFWFGFFFLQYMTLPSSKTGHFLKSKRSCRNLYGRNSVLWFPSLLECKKSSSGSRLNPGASIRRSAHLQILNLLIGENGCQGLALKSAREKKRPNRAETGEYVLLGRKSRGRWTVSRGTEIAWAETEEAAVKSELGWSWLWWTVWRQQQRPEIRIHIWSVPDWHSLLILYLTAADGQLLRSPVRLKFLSEASSYDSRFASALTNGSQLFWWQRKPERMPTVPPRCTPALAVDPPSLSH